MTLDIVIMTVGALVALLPFLGFPIHWDNIILVVLGLLTVVLGIVVRRRGLGLRTRKATTFVESTPAQGHDTPAA